MDQKEPLLSTAGTPSEPPPDYDASAREHNLPVRPRAPSLRKPAPLELPILTYLRSHKVILASASPRRKMLLSQIGLPNIEIMPSTKPENLSKVELGPFEYVAATARQKCLDVYEAAVEADKEPAVVIAADTVIVTRDGRILEKPPSEAAHIRMLQHMRDTRMHKVLTAVCCMAPKEDASHPGYEMETHIEETKVFFAKESDGLSDEAIKSYVKTREGVDKAGGYAIQGIAGMLLVEKIDGSVDNVVGLPVRPMLQLCEKIVFRQGDSGDEDEDD